MADVLGFFRKAFPFISAAASLGGPLGEMAAAAVGKALGADKNPSPTADGIAKAIADINLTPDQRLALQKAEQDFALQMQAMGFAHVEDLEAIAAGDRANARQREIDTHDYWTPRVIACIVMVGWAFIQSYLLRHIIPATMEGLISRTLGTLDMAVGLILGYYFGSSAGSAEKNSLIAKQQ